jgi:hypothetical protein
MTTPYRGRALPALPTPPRSTARFFCPVQGWFAPGEPWCCPRRCPGLALDPWWRAVLRLLVG